MTVGMAAALSLCHSDLSLCHSGRAPCYSGLFLCHSKLPFYHSELSSDHLELSSDHPEPSSGHFTPFPCHSERSEESFPTPRQKGQGNIPMAPIRLHSTCGIDLTLVSNSDSDNQHGNCPPVETTAGGYKSIPETQILSSYRPSRRTLQRNGLAPRRNSGLGCGICILKQPLTILHILLRDF